ncbi:MAG TPA: hypothetical protein VK808_09290 [Bacteroidia bacterium]|jgi:hypothetical protein|nr:hypothetical protein [Bacteroidia bacterium]
MTLLDGELITKGQGLFFIGFAAVFAVIMVVLYRQDFKRDSTYFKGTWKIFLGIIIVFAVLFSIVLSRK